MVTVAVEKGYKQTEVGVIPEDWEVKRLGEVSDVTKLAGFEYTNYFNNYKDGGEIVVLRGTNITHNKLDLSDIKTIPRSTSNFLQRSKLRKGDLVFAYVGTIGPIYLVEQDDRFHLGPNTSKITVRDDIDSKYVFFYFTGWLLRNEIIEYTSVGAQPSLSMTKIRKFKIILPPTKAEQTAIANLLSDTDELIGRLENLIIKKRNIKQGAMQELLTGKKRLPGFSGKWEEKKLGELAQIVSGGTPKTTVPMYWNGSVKWCTPTDITGCAGKYIADTERSLSKEGLANCSAQLLPAGSLLLCSRATIGELKIATTEICTNQGFKSLICAQGVSNEFLYYMLLTMKSRMIEKAFGSTFLEISKKDTASLEIELPQADEQAAIAQVLSDMDVEIEELEQKLDKYRMIKQGMMQELLTGKTRLI